MPGGLGMRKAQRAEYWKLLGQPWDMGQLILCHICRHSDWDGYDLTCEHPSTVIRLQVEEIPGALLLPVDCWAFRPRSECRTLEGTRAFLGEWEEDSQELRRQEADELAWCPPP